VAGHACLRDADAPGLASPAEVRRWLAAIGPQRADAVLALRAAEVATVLEARRQAAAAALAALRASVAAVRAAGDPLTAGQLALDGQGLMAALGCGPGPHVGEGLRALLAEVLEDPSLNDAARLVERARAWWRARPA